MRGLSGSRPPTVVLSAGAVEVAEVVCHQSVVQVGKISHRQNLFNFAAELPLEAYRANRFRLTARLRNGPELAGSPQWVDAQERFSTGIVAAAYNEIGGCLRGWAIDRLRPDRHLEIEGVLGGDVVGHAVAHFNEAAAKPPGDHGFILPITCGTKPFQKRGQIRIAGTLVSIEHGDKNIELGGRFLDPRSAVMAMRPAQDEAVIGAVDGILSNNLLSGWAINRKAPGSPVELRLFIDGAHYASTRTELPRADIRSKFGGDGRSGFVFEINPDLMIGGGHRFSVQPPQGAGKLENHEGMLRGWPAQLPDRDAFGRVARQSVAKFLAQKPANPASTRPRVALIVLNLNGAHFLRQFLSSFFKFNSYKNVEIIVVDHGSTDDSDALADAFSDRGVRLIKRNANYSFSDSNNFAARHTDADILIFANNDIIFSSDLMPRFVPTLQRKDVGAAGIKLYDASATAETEARRAGPVQHIGVHFDTSSPRPLPSPFETRPAPHLGKAATGAWKVPAVTGAFMGCRAKVFKDAGGFDGGFYYGYEDIDFCLKLTCREKLDIICRNDLAAIHIGGATRYDEKPVSHSSQTRNREALSRRWAAILRGSIRADLFAKPSFWTTHAPIVAFAVSGVGEDIAFGDYFTALEFGAALAEEYACHLTFLPPGNWYDLAGIDVLIAMRPDYDLRKARRSPSTFTSIAWARNSFREWAQRPGTDCFHMMWSSSAEGASFLTKNLRRRVDVVPIATNPRRFGSGKPTKAWSSDCCFAGNYHSDARDIEYALGSIRNHRIKIFGHDWEKAPRQLPGLMGPVSYGKVPDVYASSRIVLDDANSVTRQWGSVNSRVFDALAASRLVVTNGDRGVRELFKSPVPTYANAAQLQAVLDKYLSDNKARSRLAAKLRSEVLARHTYKHRAVRFGALLRKHMAKELRFGIKIAAPEAEKESWGDYHFACGIARALSNAGHTARIDALEHWYGPLGAGDDVVLTLRGITPYVVRAGALNLLWLLSHPEGTSLDELRTFDHVFVASELYAKKLEAVAGISSSTLLQCTDPRLFDPKTPDLGFPKYDLLFVGNARDRLRPAVKHALGLKRDLAIIGAGWEGLIPGHFVNQDRVPNDCLSTLYRCAKFVLSDHWNDMRAHGFISNRIFDATAAGARIVTDDVPGIRALFGETIGVFKDAKSFRNEIDRLEKDERRLAAGRKRLSHKVRTMHNFDARIRQLLRIVENISKRRSIG